MFSMTTGWLISWKMLGLFHGKSHLYIWANYNISLTWIKAIWGWFPLLTMIPVRSQWGRYNLPRYMDDLRSTPMTGWKPPGLSSDGTKPVWIRPWSSHEASDASSGADGPDSHDVCKRSGCTLWSTGDCGEEWRNRSVCDKHVVYKPFLLTLNTTTLVHLNEHPIPNRGVLRNIGWIGLLSDSLRSLWKMGDW